MALKEAGGTGVEKRVEVVHPRTHHHHHQLSANLKENRCLCDEDKRCRDDSKDKKRPRKTTETQYKNVVVKTTTVILRSLS